MKKLFSVLCFLSLMASVVQADVVVLKNGKKMTIAGTYEVQGQNLVFKHPNGDIVKLPLSAVDMEKSKKATDELNATLAAKAAEAPPPPPKKVGTMGAIVDHVAKENKNRENGVYISNGGLDTYSQTHARVFNDSVDSSAGAADVGVGDATGAQEGEEAGAGKPQRTSKATPVLLEDTPEVDDDAAARLADPEARKSNAEELQKKHAAASKEVEKIDASIADLERLRDANAVAVAQSDDDTSTMNHDNVQKTEKLLEDAKAARAERSKELDAIEKDARQGRVKIKSKRPPEPKAKSNEAYEDDAYDAKGRTKSRNTDSADKPKRKGDEDDYPVDDDADPDEDEGDDGVDR